MKLRSIGKYLGILAILLMSYSISLAQDQKTGYVNTVELLQEIPEVKKANSDLEALRTQLQKKFQTMVQDLQTRYQETQRKEQQGELSPKQLEEEAKLIQEEEAKLNQQQEDMQNQIQEKQQTLLQPVLDKVNDAIAKVAKANGFTLILDSSQGLVLFADESIDITDMVKLDLGIE